MRSARIVRQRKSELRAKQTQAVLAPIDLRDTRPISHKGRRMVYEYRLHTDHSFFFRRQARHYDSAVVAHVPLPDCVNAI